MLTIIVGAREKLGGELAKELKQRSSNVFLITRLKSQETNPKPQKKNQLVEVNTIELKSYTELASCIAETINYSRLITVVYFISARDIGSIADMFTTVVAPINECLALTGFDSIKHILISSQLAEQIGYEKGLNYHLEKSTLEKMFSFYAIRGEISGARYNVIRITHLLTKGNFFKYFDENSGSASKTLLNIPHKEISLPGVSDLANAVELIVNSDGLNGAIIDLDQGGRFISATSERSGFREVLKSNSSIE